MSQELQAKVIDYNNKYQTLKPQYEDIMLRMQAQVDIIQELNTRLPDSLTSKDWTQYGLVFLQSKQKSLQTQDELYCAQGMNNPQSLSYNLYKQNLQDLNDVTAELNVRQSEIESATAIYNSVKAERDTLQQQLDMDNWFTVDEWKSLDNYVIEATYDNDNYIVTDLEDDSERFDIERQLYETAWKDLEKKCRPQYQYSSTLSNILTIPEFKEFIPYFELGNFIHMETDYDTIVRLRIISYTVDYTNTQNIAVTFSDAIRVKDVYEDASSIQAQANSAAMSFQFNKDQYDSTVKQGNWVAEMRKYGLDVATVAIHNASNQNQTWDDTGFTFRKWNDESKQYDPEQIKIINNQIVFSDDGMNTVRMALGKIALGNNEFAYGLNAEVLVSKLVMSENLWIENNSGTYKFDDAGFIASSGKNTIKIQPNNSGELFSIYKDSNKQFYINSDGDVEYAGTLRGATGIFSGLISGGEININNTFTVDKNGNMYASSGTFTGTIYCSSGTIGGWTIGTNSLYANATSTSLGVFDSVLMPGQLSFKNYSDQKTLIINPVNIAWDNGGLTKITESSITTTDLSTTDLSFVRGSNPKITWTGQLSFATDLNVHFSKTPYVDNSSDGYNGYVAKSSWVKDKFALKSSLSDYLTKSYASTLYAPKEHSHPKYTTESEVRSIVRSMVKSKYLN